MDSILTVGRTEVSFTNKTLQNATMHIFKIGESLRRNWLEVGALIAGVDGCECYKEDGFKDVHEWVEKTFKIKKSTSYDLLRIGKEYVREIRSTSGKVTGYECNLLPEGATDNFNTTQIRRMLPAGYELASELVTNGEITPTMSSAKIKQVIDAHLGKSEATSEEPQEEAAPKAEPKTRQDELRKIFDSISTSELIEELNRRGFYVYNEEGKEMKVND